MIEIRAAALTDAAQLHELMRLFPAPTRPTEAYITECLSFKVTDPNSYVAVAEENGILIGYISGYRHHAFYAGGQTGWCDELFVRTDRRQRGQGRLLMEGLEAWAKLHGCVLVSLATAGASRFYEAIGYQTKAGYYKKYL